MEEHNQNYAHIINLPTVNFKSQSHLSIDSNTHIKQVINIETCLIDAQIEPMLNKAIIKGSIGVKVIYIDTDNMFNSISDNITFNETIISDNITPECQIIIGNNQFICDSDNDDNNLNINLEANFNCYCNLNQKINTIKPNSDLITKKSALSTCTCVQQINKTVNFDFDCKLDGQINKILCYDSKIIIEDCKCYDGYCLISGQINNTIIYEIGEQNNLVKIYNNSTPFKSEIESAGCDTNCLADLNAYINPNTTQITPQINDTYTQMQFEYSIVTSGYIYKNISLEIIDDIYSLESFVEPEIKEYRFCQKLPFVKTYESVDAEITLSDDLNIDEILGMINTNANITQYSVKDNLVVLEGVINGNLLYFDENRQIKRLPSQLPFSINIKQELPDEICGLHLNIIPTNCKCKIKRGNTLIIDYELCINGNIYTCNTIPVIENVKYGKPIQYRDVTFQIYIARKNESPWDLCKRLHITQEQLLEFNNENPPIYQGGEKIIIYR